MTTINYTAQTGAVIASQEVGAWCGEDSTTDLSGNTNDLTETGALTISDTLVNGPAIQHSGWSVSNYLRRAYDTDFDMGITGFTITAWINFGATSLTGTVLERAVSTYAGSYFTLYVSATGQVGSVVRDNTTTATAITTDTFEDAGWKHVAVTWDGADTTKIYIDGVLNTTDVNGTTLGTLDHTVATLSVGINANDLSPCQQGLSLVKIYDFEASVTSLAFVYDTEKVMYLEGGQYTEFGTSVTVTFPVQGLNRSGKAVRTDKVSIGGTKQTLFDREEVMWDIVTSELTGAAVIDVQVMLAELIKGVGFTIDQHDNAIETNATLDSRNYTAERIEVSDYFTYSFTVRED